MLSRLITTPLLQSSQSPSFHTLTQWPSSFIGTAGGAWNSIAIRTKVRDHFPRAKETKRVLLHSYKKRMLTHGGRKIIMRNILKNRHVLAG